MEAAEADPRRIAEQRALILKALPRNVFPTLKDQDAFFEAVTRAVESYLALVTRGDPRRREHRRTDEQRHPSAAHRPTDAPRQSLIGDLFDAYMTLRADDLEARGFKKLADVVLEVARVPITVMANDRSNLQKRIHDFAKLTAPRKDDPDEPK
jgi:hypothetical protein